MELSFATVALREICETRRAAIDALGISAATELAQRLADVQASENVSEFASLFPDDMVHRSSAEKAVRLNAGVQVVFCSGHAKTPVTSDGHTDWEKVTRIRIVAIEANNG